MPFNGSGTFVLPAGNPVSGVSNSTIHNNTNSEIAVALTNCITRDGQSPATENIPMGGFKITGLAAGINPGEAMRVDEGATKSDLQTQSHTKFTAGGTADAITGALSPAISSYTAGLVVTATVAANTSATPTIAINGLSAVTVKKYDATGAKVALSAGDQVGICRWQHDGTDFVLLNPMSATSSAIAIREGIKAHLLMNEWADIIGPFVPQGFNQQWGGNTMPIEVDGTLYGCASTNLGGTSYSVMGSSAGATYKSLGFKVPSDCNADSVLIQLSKVGNPTNNLQVFIYSDNGSGKPNALITNGTATAQSGKLHNVALTITRFVFPTPPALTGGTQYHVVMKSSGSVDASNYWNYGIVNPSAYPYGFVNAGDATPTWTSTTTVSGVFAIIPTAATSRLVTGGTLGKKKWNLGTDAGLPSKYPLYRYLDHTGHCTIPLACNLAVADKGKAFFDVGTSLDRNRIRFSTTAAGYLQVELWNSAGAKVSVTGTTDVCTGSMTRKTLKFRCAGDGADYLSIYNDDAEQGTGLTAQTFAMDASLSRQYICLGWGWPTAPTWTGGTDFANWVIGTSRPDKVSGSWTTSGVGTETAQFAISGSNLVQVASGFASTDYRWFEKATSFVNANGGVVSIPNVQLLFSGDTVADQSANIGIFDGTKYLILALHSYYIGAVDANSTKVQIDLKSSPINLRIWWKGSDYKVYANNILIIDGTGLMTLTSASNIIRIGDNGSTAGENSQVIWGDISYKEGATDPESLAASTLEEVAFIERNVAASFLASLCNGGTRKSIKELCGLEDDVYLAGGFGYQKKLYGITSSPTTSLASLVAMPDLNAFILGPYTVFGEASMSNSGTNYTYMSFSNVSAITGPTQGQALKRQTVAGYESQLCLDRKTINRGLNYEYLAWACNAGTETSAATRRSMTITGE